MRSMIRGISRFQVPLQETGANVRHVIQGSSLWNKGARFLGIELIDGAAQNATAAIGAIRANALRTTNTIGNIQRDSLPQIPT